MHDFFNDALAQTRALLSSTELKGETVIDATAGNGKDTLFLAQLVGEKGMVYAFDIQKEALNTTEKLLQQNNISWCKTIHDSHEELDQYNINQPKAVVFNLGYLPGGNHDIITKPLSTLTGIKNALNMLKVGGILTVVIYTGHEGGKEEEETLKNYFNSLSRNFDVLQAIPFNCFKNAPYLIAVRKARGLFNEVEKTAQNKGIDRGLFNGDAGAVS